jgi:predicted metal-dependent hydrolase
MPRWDALPRGAALFNQGLYWEAHEAWEELWLELDGSPRRFVQGLIQVAAAGHKAFSQRQPRGCVKLLRSGLEKLDGSPADFLGVETSRLLAAARRTLAEAEQWLSGARPGLDPAAFPRLELVGPPAEKK